ncbi:MAG: IclR family transcriptional regulator [Candidatus Dormiibacterota bacterium]
MAGEFRNAEQVQIDGGGASVPGTAYLERMLALLNVLAESPHGLTLAQVADRAGLKRPTGHRMLTTLTNVGLVNRTEQRTYEVGSALLRLCAVNLPRLELRQICRPHMERMSRQSGETVVLAVPVDDDYLFLDRIESQHEVRQTVALGTRFPLIRGASGTGILMGQPPLEAEATVRRANFTWPVPGTRRLDAGLVLRELDQSRSRGYAWSEGECAPDSFSISTPLTGGDGRPAGSLAIAGPRSRFNLRTSASAARLLMTVAKDLSVSTAGLRRNLNTKAGE